MGAQGTFVANNNVVSQSVAHLHVHVVPRTKGDGLRGFFWPRTRYGPGEAAAVGERLRVALAAAEVTLRTAPRKGFDGVSCRCNMIDACTIDVRPVRFATAHWARGHSRSR